MQAGLFKRLDNCVSSLKLFSGSGWDVWFFGNKLINKITSGSYPLALKSVYLRSYYFIHQNKPDHVGYQEAKGFYDPSTYSWEKGCITCLRNFWIPCSNKMVTQICLFLQDFWNILAHNFVNDSKIMFFNRNIYLTTCFVGKSSVILQLRIA